MDLIQIDLLVSKDIQIESNYRGFQGRQRACGEFTM